MNLLSTKSPIVRAIHGENLGRFPVWMMRQAGRYLSSYQEVRARYSFWQMATLSEVAAEVSLLPLKELPLDGVIFFSDILTPAYALDLGVEMRESVGPVLAQPLRSEREFAAFERFSPQEHVPYVGKALSLIREATAGRQTVLGFAGAPWTVGCYLIEGQSSRHFEHTLRFASREPAAFRASLEKLADSTLAYLLYQVESGAEVVQLFDTWLGAMPRSFFDEVYCRILNRIFIPLKERGIPALFFTKEAHHLDGSLQALEASGLSVDSLLPLPEMAQRTGGRFFLQGNLDPVFLKVASEAQVRLRTRELVAEARQVKNPVVLNLGHGILPGTPLQNAQAFVTEARCLWV